MSGLSNLDDVRKTAVIDKELMRLKVDIAALQETRLANSGFVKEHYTFWQGKPEQETWEYGVRFAVRNHLQKSQMINPPTEGIERMLTLDLSTEQDTTNILCIYAPTMSASPETKNKFYDDLNIAVKNIPSNEFLLLLRDLNARVGSERHMANLPGLSWNLKDEWKWTTPTVSLLHTQFLCDQQFLPDKAPSEGIMETPKIWPLTPNGSDNHQTSISQQCSHHQQLSQLSHINTCYLKDG